MRRIREQIFDDTQQICRIHTKILAKYVRIRNGYSQYAAAYLRMELVISVIVQGKQSVVIPLVIREFGHGLYIVLMPAAGKENFDRDERR